MHTNVMLCYLNVIEVLKGLSLSLSLSLSHVPLRRITLLPTTCHLPYGWDSRIDMDDIRA